MAEKTDVSKWPMIWYQFTYQETYIGGYRRICNPMTILLGESLVGLAVKRTRKHVRV